MGHGPDLQRRDLDDLRNQPAHALRRGADARADEGRHLVVGAREQQGLARQADRVERTAQIVAERAHQELGRAREHAELLHLRRQERALPPELDEHGRPAAQEERVDGLREDVDEIDPSPPRRRSASRSEAPRTMIGTARGPAPRISIGQLDTRSSRAGGRRRWRGPRRRAAVARGPLGLPSPRARARPAPQQRLECHEVGGGDGGDDDRLGPRAGAASGATRGQSRAGSGSVALTRPHGGARRAVRRGGRPRRSR